jgi:S1-C subfamily serine protease
MEWPEPSTGPEVVGEPDTDRWEPGATPPQGPTRSPHHHHVHTRTIVAGAVAFVALGAAIGTVLTPSANSPRSGPTQGTAATGGSSSRAVGAPPNSAALAARTEGALVDINVTDSYQAVQGAGTGMVLTAQGIVLTNNHVIEGETSVSVRDVGNGSTYGATVLGYDQSQDIAVLRLVDASGLQTIGGGASGLVAVGDGVVAVGNAQGAGGTPSHAGGKVTALNQSIAANDEVSGTSEQLTGLIQTNADIVPGYSGGALVNTSARVIGMVTAASQGYQFGSNAAQGYAIPMATARRIATQIVAGHKSDTVHIGATPFLGVHLTRPSEGTPGALVASLVTDGPGDRAGLQSGDVITDLNGASVDSPDSLLRELLRLSPGTTVHVGYLDQSGRQQDAEVTLGNGPPQ